jgi:hypothetical protein
MPTSKLKQYVDITKLLMEYGPQTISQIRSVLKNQNPDSLKHDLDFLSENKILTKGPTEENLSYAIGERGFGLLTYFKIKP